MGQILSFAAARAKLIKDTGMSRVAAWHDFLTDLKLAEKTERTIGQHQAELRRYAVWLDENRIDWRGVSPAELASYARTRAHLSPSSRNALVTMLRVFYRWCVTQEILERSPAERLVSPKRTKAAPRALSGEQIRVLLDFLDREAAASPCVRLSRDRALLLTALYTGMRAAELAALCWSTVDLNSHVIVVEKGKGQKGRALKIHPELEPILTAWHAQQPLKASDGPVFAIEMNTALVPNRIGKIMRRYAKATGLPLTAHVLRHSFATHALRRSGNLYAVSKALGHGQLQQTMIYIRTDARDGEPAIDAMPSMADW